MTDNNKENDNRFEANQSDNLLQDNEENVELVSGQQDIISDSFKFYTAMHSLVMFDYIKNTTSDTVMSEERIKKISDVFSKIFNKNILIEIYLACSTASTCIPSLKNEESCNFRNFLILYTIECEVKNNTDKMIKFLKEIQEDTFKHANITFKFLFLACYIHLYISLKDYDNAYKYCMEAGNFITEDVELYYYSALNLIFDKQNKTECFEITQKIINTFNNKILEIDDYSGIALCNHHLKDNTGNHEFLKLYIYFLKKIFKNFSDKKQKGNCLSYISTAYYLLKKYYMAIGYGKIALKYLENKKIISETLDFMASSYYFLSKYERAIEFFQQLIQFDNIDKAFTYIQISDCQHKLGNIEAMKENAKKAYLIGSNDTEIQEAINELYQDIERGKYDNIHNN